MPNQGALIGYAYKIRNAVKATGDVLKEVTAAVGEFAKKTDQTFRTVSGRWMEMQDIAFQTGRAMAMSRENAMKYDRMLMDSTKNLARQYGITAKELANFQKTYAESVGRNIILTRRQIEQMSALSKITDSATAAQLVDEFDKIGVGVAGTTARIGLLQERAKTLGVNATKATALLRDNIKLAASYSFKNGVNDIERMSLRAASLRMDMNAITSAMDKFSNINDAISTSARIQMLGGGFAQNFSNPMGAMYESIADPASFMKRLEDTIAGKGRYDEKSGQVTFDPIAMMQMKAMAESLGVSVEQLTNPAMAKVQDERVNAELERNANYSMFSDADREAIRNLSRTNVDEDNGRHYVTVIDDNGDEQRKYVDTLTKEELRIAQDSQMTQEELFSDVQEIKEILRDTLGRARGTTSMKENRSGLIEEINSAISEIQNIWSGGLSKWLNGSSFKIWDYPKQVTTPARKIAWGSNADGFNEGGIVKAKPAIHAAFGAIIPGTSTMGDHTPVMANAGEMILNQGQQKGLFDLLKSVAATGAMYYYGNKMGNKIGVKGVGTNLAIGGMFGTEGMMLHAAGKYLLGKRLKSKGLDAKSIGIKNGLTSMAKNATSFAGENMGITSLTNETKSNTKSITANSRALQELSRRIQMMNNGGFGDRGRGHRGGRGRGANNTNLKAKRASNAKIAKKKQNVAPTDIISNVASAKPNNTVNTANAATKNVASKTTNIASKSAKLLGKSGSIIKGGTKMLGRVALPVGLAVSAVDAIGTVSSASSTYEEQKNLINGTQMSEREKARARDYATKEKNSSIGKGIGGTVGATALGAAGFALGGPIGAMIGASVGQAVGSFVGKGIGGLFRGNEEVELDKKTKNIAKGSDSKEVVNILRSIDNKMPLAVKSLNTPSVKPVDEERFTKVKPTSASESTQTSHKITMPDLKLNISGTIKLDAGTRTADIDVDKLLNNHVFIRELSKLIGQRFNVEANVGNKYKETTYTA